MLFRCFIYLSLFFFFNIIMMMMMIIIITFHFDFSLCISFRFIFLHKYHQYRIPLASAVSKRNCPRIRGFAFRGSATSTPTINSFPVPQSLLLPSLRRLFSSLCLVRATFQSRLRFAIPHCIATHSF